MRFYGVIGYGIPKEDEYGVVTNTIVERKHFGDVPKVVTRNEGAQQVNDNIRLGNSFSIVLDPFLRENFQYVKYIVFNGVKWAVGSVTVDPDRPRLNIEAGQPWSGLNGGGTYGPQT